jgi:hypothetical protein
MNQAHGLASLYLIKDTTMDEEVFSTKFHGGNIVAVKVEVILSDGTVHIIDSNIMDLEWNEFQNNRENNIEKATKQTA